MEPDNYSYRMKVGDTVEIRHLNSSQLYDVAHGLRHACFEAMKIARAGDEDLFDVSAESPLKHSELARVLLLGLPDEIEALLRPRQ